MIGKTSSVTAYVLALKKRNVSSSSIYFQTHILFESKINKGFAIFYINSSPRTLFWVLQHSQLSPRNTVWVLQHHPLHPLHGQRARALFPGCSDSASPYFFKQPIIHVTNCNIYFPSICNMWSRSTENNTETHCLSQSSHNQFWYEVPLKRQIKIRMTPSPRSTTQTWQTEMYPFQVRMINR